MEVSSNLISYSVPCYYSSFRGADTQLGNSISAVSRVGFRGRDQISKFGELKLKGRAKIRRQSDCGFVENGHLDYYYNRVSPVCGEKKEKFKGKGKNNGCNQMSTKKKMKLVKGLMKDLTELSELGFGLQLDCDKGLVGDNERTKKTTEAAEVLLAQLKLLRAEEEKKSEKGGKLKSEEQDCESSSSSESSESECDEVIDMKCFSKASVVQTIENPKELTMDSQECCNMILETTLDDNAAIEVLNTETQNPNQLDSVSCVTSLTTMAPPPNGKRVEVCMGGKCKKSGGVALMDEFQRVLGDEAAVVGCKCMGKCKSGPNVRVLKGDDVDDDSMRTPSNSVITGVGLEDVELIVANYLGAVAITPLALM